MDEVYHVLDALPGSAIIMSYREQGLLDFLEGDLNRAPTMRWMAHGGRAIVESFGVDPLDRRRDLDRLVSAGRRRMGDRQHAHDRRAVLKRGDQRQHQAGPILRGVASARDTNTGRRGRP